MSENDGNAFAANRGALAREPSSDAHDDDLIVTTGRDILLVDDNQTNLIAIEAALLPLGRTLVLARSGVEALGKLLQQDFALILLDVQMPGMDGFETARLIRARARNRRTPIIFVTGLSWHDEDVLRGYELGAFDFLVKPIRPEVLRAKASTFVQLQERTMELAIKAEELRRAQAREHERELAMQRRRMESELLEYQMKQLAESDKRKDEFLAILAHELRNPLQPLLSSIEVIEQSPNEPVSPRIRKIVMRQLDHLTRLVDDLLDVARFTSGKLELVTQRVTIDTLIEDALAAARPLADSKKHAVTVTSDGSAPVIQADPVRLVQILVNLLNNAAKYTAAGGAITIHSGTRAATLEMPARAFVTIADNGRGIARDLLPRVFDMFVQERAGSDGAGGLGLGLGLVKRLIDLHGGSVRADSAGRDAGATFEIELPLATAPRPTATASAAPAAPAPVTRKLRAVVVDDAPDLRDLVSDLLRMHGHEVTTLEDGASALAVICAERPDVALIDIGLPEMDGYEIARRLRAELGTHHIRLIAMTGYGQHRDRDAALAAGFDAHLIKPASSAEILRAIHTDD